MLLITGSFSSITSFDAKYANEIKMEVMGKTVVIKTDVLVHANKKQTVIKYENPSSNSQNTLSLNFPDSILFIKKKWYNFTDGKQTEIPFDTLSIIATEEYKTVCSFKCQKFKIANSNSGESVCWVSKELPKNLIPFPGLKGLPGAVLEYENLNTGISFKMKTIEVKYGKK